jgi:iron complex outermembrane receptor protein
LLTFTVRDDGSSRFSKENRWAVFPSAAFAYKLNKDLFSKSKTINDLKLRVGWGITGQQDINQETILIWELMNKVSGMKQVI